MSLAVIWAKPKFHLNKAKNKTDTMLATFYKLPFGGPLAQASMLTEHAIEVQHKIAFQKWASQYEQEPDRHYKKTRWFIRFTGFIAGI